ncbi:MAG: LysM peptidoglycan-binding domain-containing protein [Gammaproteobacteria bacterium]|nr:LysM peptidoglycan-binding domain-containing protein [Gammaproteobacteria bacterium]
MAATSVTARSAKAAPTAGQLQSERNIQYANLWDRIRAGLSLPTLDSPHIARHELWFANNPEFMEAMVGRARLYLYYIVEEVEKRGMPIEIALLPAIESAYKPYAYSRAKASGLWQFIPSTGRLYGLHANWWYDGRRDVMASTQAALDYLEKLKTDFDGDWQLALASYNCGEGKVARLLEANRRKGLPATYSALKTLPRETQHYVPRLMAFVNIVSDPAKYGVQLAPIPNEPYFERVDAGSQVDLGVVARLTDLPVSELYQINPGYSRWITDPNGPHHLLVPADKKDMLLAGLSTLPDEERVQWARHEVQRGETINQIARKHNVTVDALKSANHLTGTGLATGQNLLIPAAPGKLAQAGPPPTPAPAAKQASVPVNQDKVHVVHRVRTGDTLWNIAKRYSVNIAQLREWNLLGPKDAIKLGQKLTVWTHRANASASLAQIPPG